MFLFVIKKKRKGTSLVVRWLRLHHPMQEVPVRPLVGELRSYMPCGQKPKKCTTETIL